MTEFSIWPKSWVNALDGSVSCWKTRAPVCRTSVTRNYLSFPLQLWKELGHPPLVSVFYLGHDMIVTPSSELRIDLEGHRAKINYKQKYHFNFLMVPGHYPDPKVITISGHLCVLTKNCNAQFVDKLEHWKTTETRLKA